MINADVITAPNNIFLVRFSEPNEDFLQKVYVPVLGIEEVRRRMYFRNRVYILTTLKGWLEQRKFGNYAHIKECINMISWLSEYQNASFFKLCDFIARKRADFEEIAPTPKSKYYQHYIKTIVPIFDFAEFDEYTKEN